METPCDFSQFYNAINEAVGMGHHYNHQVPFSHGMGLQNDCHRMARLRLFRRRFHHFLLFVCHDCTPRDSTRAGEAFCKEDDHRKRTFKLSRLKQNKKTFRINSYSTAIFRNLLKVFPLQVFNLRGKKCRAAVSRLASSRLSSAGGTQDTWSCRLPLLSHG